MSPSARQEGIGRPIATLVGELAVERGMDVLDAGHTTFRRENLDRGFEPDCSLYPSENADRGRGRYNLDLNADPPPDLVFEADITNPSLDKPPIYARLGVGEIWRYAAGRMEILVLDEVGEGYEAATESRALHLPQVGDLRRLIGAGLTSDRPAWIREVRGWARNRGA